MAAIAACYNVTIIRALQSFKLIQTMLRKETMLFYVTRKADIALTYVKRC